jgi:hypothetical protein
VAVFVENLGYRQLTAFWRVAGMVNWALRRPIAWGSPPRGDAPTAGDGTTLASSDPAAG